MVRVLDLSNNKLSHFPGDPLLLSPYNALQGLQSIVISGTAVRNIPAPYHHNIAPLLRRTRVDASSSDEVNIAVLGDGKQGKTSVIDHSLFADLDMVLPKGNTLCVVVGECLSQSPMHRVVQTWTRGSLATYGAGPRSSTCRPALWSSCRLRACTVPC